MKKYLSLLLSVTMMLSTFFVGSQIVNAATYPSGSLSYNGHHYYVYSDAKTWEEAKEKCKKRGGHLAVINSSKENDALFNYMKSQGRDSAYFGYSDSVTEGKWKWVDNKTSSYTNWHYGEPNSENQKEDYAQFFYKFTDGTWNDGDFGEGENEAYICEWEYYVKLSESEIIINVGSSRIVEYTVIGGTENQRNQTAYWSSSNTNVAKVSSKGKIVAIGTGTCLITCKVGTAKKSLRVIVRPKKVQNFAVSSKTTTSVTFKWNRLNNVTGYRIYMYDSDIQEYTYVKTVDGAFRTTTVKGLKKGKTYKFKIRAYVKVNGKNYYGTYSDVLKVTTKR